MILEDAVKAESYKLFYLQWGFSNGVAGWSACIPEPVIDEILAWRDRELEIEAHIKTCEELLKMHGVCSCGSCAIAEHDLQLIKEMQKSGRV